MRREKRVLGGEKSSLLCSHRNPSRTDGGRKYRKNEQTTARAKARHGRANNAPLRQVANKVPIVIRMYSPSVGNGFVSFFSNA